MKRCISLFCAAIFLFSYNESTIFEPFDTPVYDRSTLSDEILLPEGGQPESIAIGNGHTAYVSCGGLNGAILNVDLQSGAGEYLVAPVQGRTFAGVTFDARQHDLYAAGAFQVNVSIFQANTGALIAEFQLADPRVPAPGSLPSSLVNDLVVTKDAVCITDSFKPVLDKIALGPAGALPQDAVPDTIPLTGEFVMTMDAPLDYPINANGIDATPNEKVLIIINTSTGVLFHTDPGTGYAKAIDLGRESMIFGEGLLLNGKCLYVVRNFRNLIARSGLAPDYLPGGLADVITSTGPPFQIPTLADVFGSWLYAVDACCDVAPPRMPVPDVSFQVVRVLM